MVTGTDIPLPPPPPPPLSLSLSCHCHLCPTANASDTAPDGLLASQQQPSVRPLKYLQHGNLHSNNDSVAVLLRFLTCKAAAAHRHLHSNNDSVAVLLRSVTFKAAAAHSHICMPESFLGVESSKPTLASLALRPILSSAWGGCRTADQVSAAARNAMYHMWFKTRYFKLPAP